MRYISISSALNPRIQEVIRMRQRKSLSGERTFLIEGPHLLEMAISAGKSVQKIFFTEQFLSKKYGQRLLKQVAKDTSEIYEVTEHLLKKISDTDTPQGIVATVSYKPMLLDTLSLQSMAILTVIDGIQDPGNLGTIIRTSDAAGADAVIMLPGTCNAFMPKVIRATAGSIFNMPIVYTEIAALLKWSEENKIKLVVTSADAEKSVFDAELNFPVAFVFGNEAHGVSEHLRKYADLILKIPIFGKAESLNVATSSAICLYEAVRQRNKINPKNAFSRGVDD